METLWSPWRSKYIDTFKDNPKEGCKTCFFCEAAESTSEKNADLLVVARYPECFIMLNRYPYNSHHSLIAPYRHISSLEQLSDSELCGIMSAVKDTVKILDHTLKPDGYNIGANLGRVAGAGVPGHIHFHVVPRWNGDTSFVSVISDIKVISVAIQDTQKQMEEAFQKLLNGELK